MNGLPFWDAVGYMTLRKLLLGGMSIVEFAESGTEGG